MKKIQILIFVLLFITFLSCEKEDENINKIKLAKVFDKVLYAEDLDGTVPEGISSEDSVIIVKRKIEIWIRKQLMINKAEINLSEEQQNINKIVEDYRTSLLIDKYKQEFIKQELDTTITDSEIESYYTLYHESFKSDREIVKAKFYKIPKGSEHFGKFRRLFFSTKDSLKLDEFVNEHKLEHEYFNNKWIPFSEILIMLPTKISNPKRILKSTKNMQSRDGSFFYFVNIKNYRLTGDPKPIEAVKAHIRIILYNKRKIELIKELENNIYLNAFGQGNIKIY